MGLCIYIHEYFWFFEMGVIIYIIYNKDYYKLFKYQKLC